MGSYFGTSEVLLDHRVLKFCSHAINARLLRHCIPRKKIEGKSTLFNLHAYAQFPDMALLYSMFDEPPVRRSEDEPGPWFRYCGIRQEVNNLVCPSDI